MTMTMDEQQEKLASRFIDQIIACAEIRIIPQDLSVSVGIARPIWADECRGVDFLAVSKVEKPDTIDISITPCVQKENVTGTRFDLGKVMRVFKHCLTIHAILSDKEPNFPITVVVGMYEGVMIRLYLHLEASVTPGEKMDNLAALVLCKSELFYQTATGDTLLTEYPCCVEAGKRRAAQLGVPFSKE